MNSWADVLVPPIDSTISIPPLQLFDSATQGLLTVTDKDVYRMYVCGITPYDATHLGHAATYLTFDLINRYLRARGATVHFVQNITDIDDPLLERARRDNVDWRELAQSQIDLFRGDMVNLHIIAPDHYVGVVEAMDLVVQEISTLVHKGAAYAVDKDLYFDVHSDQHFGERSHLSSKEMVSIFAERGGDPSKVGKRDPLDALLWLAHREGEPSWISPFGEGRPGWHIECCAIALHYLRPDEDAPTSIDIQGGGSDLIFPHHEMSAAQGAVLRNKPFAAHYVHSGMIGLDGEKMSKSKGNLVFVSRLLAEGVDPMVIRWALTNRLYSDETMWNANLLADATRKVAIVRKALSHIECAPTSPIMTAIADALSRNLDTVTALKLIVDWAEATNSGVAGDTPGNFSRFIDSVLGLAL